MAEKKTIGKEDEISKEVMDYIIAELKNIESQKGSYQAENDKKLDALGITHIMNITSDYKPFEDKYTYLCVGNIMDSDSDARLLKPQFSKILDFIHNAIINNKKVLVHCAAGISRSSTVVIGYLMYKWKLPLKTAFKICRDKRPGVWPNSGFLGMLLEIEKELYGKVSLKKDTWTIEEC